MTSSTYNLRQRKADQKADDVVNDEKVLPDQNSKDETEGNCSCFGQFVRTCKAHWDNWLWLLACPILLWYYSVPQTVLSGKLMSYSFVLGCGCWFLFGLIGAYFILYLNFLKGIPSAEWHTNQRRNLFPTATIFFITGFVMFVHSAWPVYGAASILILSSIIMSCVIFVSFLP